MAAPIVGVSPASVRGIEPGAAAAPAAGPAAGGFGEILKEAVRKVEEYQKAADASVERFLKGEEEDLHRVAMVTQQAEVAFEMFLQVKNKVLQAYQEVMRMQV
jgi:flagellar hook-basal body complex protein FliE